MRLTKVHGGGEEVGALYLYSSNLKKYWTTWARRWARRRAGRKYSNRGGKVAGKGRKRAGVASGAHEIGMLTYVVLLFLFLPPLVTSMVMID